ncbi:protein lifeguard 3-like isoform X2 [Tigriopus californicus]|uniref:protein lifeguard 3-like isoform X2 n=1 Tax=Tigriopus californicus TaxID=6832 RepID=UPI0027DA5228|nr:protein lifeguard 3-like isoform X2 [Tigriopus californicus]
MDPKYSQQQPYAQPYPSNGGGFNHQPGFSQQPSQIVYPAYDHGAVVPQPGYNYQGAQSQGVHPSQVGIAPQFPSGHQGYQNGPQGNYSISGNGGYDSDGERGIIGESLSAFSDKAVRRGFIRKVYGILSVQLLITCGLISIFVFVKPLRDFAIENESLYWIAFAVTMVCMIAMVCCESVRRKSPTNFVFLGIFTICEGFMMGSLAAHFEADAVLIAAGTCAVVTLALTVFAFQSKYDFTVCGGMLLALLLILLLGGILMAILPNSKWAMIGYGSAGALIFSLYIVYDTQIMMGGKHKYALSPEEYIFAALNLYLDIINLFVYLLMIIGIARSD